MKCFNCGQEIKPIKKESPVITIFRRWKRKPNTSIALFPKVPADAANKFCMSYERIGQHGAADYHGVIRDSYPMSRSAAEKDGLLKELEGIGYKLDVREGYRHRK